MPKPRFTEEELIQILRESEKLVAEGNLTEESGYHTFDELRRKTGYSERKLRRALRTLVENKQVEVRSIHRPNIAGILTWSIGYRILGGKLE